MLGSEKRITKPKNPIPPIWPLRQRPLPVTIAGPLDTSVRNVPSAFLTHRISEEDVVEAKAEEARATAVEEAADEEDFHSNEATALATETAILPEKMARKLGQTIKENAIFAAVIITPPIPATRPKTLELFSSLRKPDTRMKKNTPI
jgi:hypothetical protein